MNGQNWGDPEVNLQIEQMETEKRLNRLKRIAAEAKKKSKAEADKAKKKSKAEADKATAENNKNQNMKTSKETAKIDAALAKCQGEIKHAIKNVVQSHFKTNYADLPAVRSAAQEAMSKNGIAFICTPEIREWIVIAEKEVMPTDPQESKTVIKKQQLIHKEVMIARIIHSGEWYEAETFLKMKGKDDDPHAFGSASTYARRYLMCSLLNITADGEDDDGEGAMDRNAEPVKIARRNSDNKRPTLRKAADKGDML